MNLLYYIFISCLLSGSAYARSGGTNAYGCHAGSQPYHCHTPKTPKYTPPKKTIYKNEKFYNDIYCAEIKGRREVRHSFKYSSGESYIFVDCETNNKVIEGGLDKRSSLDSTQQALFFAHITNKKPVVVIYDTDKKIGDIEHRIKAACAIAGVEFIRISAKW